MLEYFKDSGFKMIIKQISVKKLYGFKDLTIDFDRKLNFLIGINGSGKTSILRLLEAALLVNPKDLLDIKFEEFNVRFQRDGEDKLLKVLKEKDKITFEIDKEKLRLPVITEDTEVYSDKRYSMYFLDEFRFRHKNNIVYKYLAEINPILFLGIERKTSFLSNEDTASKSSSASKSRRWSNLSESLAESEKVINQAYKRMRYGEIQLDINLKKEIMLSLFEYNDVHAMKVFSKEFRTEIAKKEGLLKKKGEVLDVVLGIEGVSDTVSKGKMESYFNQLEKIINEIKQATTDEGIRANWISVFWQAEKLEKIVSIIDEYNEKKLQNSKAFTDFLMTLNSFFNDSGKKIEVDAVGKTIVKYLPTNEEIPLIKLSSGEIQLLIMFTFLMFGSYIKSSNVVVIDEPEISLHLKWQSAVVENALRSSADNTQFIFATHSPEIIADKSDFCIDLTLSSLVK